MYRESLRTAERGRLRLQTAITEANLAQVLIRAGRTAEGKALLDKAEPFFRNGRYHDQLFYTSTVRFDEAIARRDLTAAGTLAAQTLEESSRWNNPVLRARALRRAAHMGLETGDYPRAAAYLREARGEYEKLGQREGMLTVATNEAGYHIILGDRAAASAAIETARQLTASLGGHDRNIKLLEARLALMEGRWNDSLGLLQSARASLPADATAERTGLGFLEGRALALAGRAREAQTLARRGWLARGGAANAVDTCDFAGTLFLAGQRGEAALLAAKALAASAGKLMPVNREACALAWAASAPGNPAARRAYDEQFEALAKSWPAATRAQYRRRADLRGFLTAIGY